MPKLSNLWSVNSQPTEHFWPAVKAFFTIMTFAILCTLCLPSYATERITQFNSTIEIRADRSLLVTEIIDVIAENITIRHGIYRDFPTVYPHPDWGALGIREKTGFELISIKLDGQDTPWRKAPRSNGLRIYIGDPNHLLVSGKHRFEIRYITTGQVSSLNGEDMLYWNVNGQGWVIPSDRVSATVTFPGQSQAVGYDAWTGLYGSKHSDVDMTENSDQSISFDSRQGFAPFEGMTIFLGLPTATVTPQENKFVHLFKDNYLWFGSFLLLLLMPLYYFKAWQKVGRDPQKGVVVADFRPVRNLSPAAHRFITTNTADNVAFSSALINIAIKGYARIEQQAKDTFIVFDTSSNDAGETNRVLSKHKLSKIEGVVHKTLFGSADSVHLGDDYDSDVALAKKQLGKLLRLEWRDAVYMDNRHYSWFGLLVGLAALLMAALHFGNAELNYLKLLPLGIFLVIGIGMTQRKLKVFALLPIGFFIINSLRQTSFSDFDSFGMLWLGLFVAALFVLFNYLLKAPTPFGRKLMDEIEGFKLYLSTAEQHRLNMLHPPEKTPQLFENLLPYAIALGVENQWSAQFTEILARSADQQEAYQPRWYSGDRTGFKSASSGFALGTGLASSIASSATAPSSSSSGFSSGGGAGGGGGGGGGGGW